MLLQSLRALCKAPGGPGSIWKSLEALVWATGVTGRLARGFQPDSHFAAVTLNRCITPIKLAIASVIAY